MVVWDHGGVAMVVWGHGGVAMVVWGHGGVADGGKGTWWCGR